MKYNSVEGLGGMSLYLYISFIWLLSDSNGNSITRVRAMSRVMWLY